MMGLVVRARVAMDKQQEFLQSMESLAAHPASGQDSGSPAGFFRAVNAPDEFLLYERWAERADLDGYMNSERFGAILGAIRVLGRLLEMHIVDDQPAQRARLPAPGSS